MVFRIANIVPHDRQRAAWWIYDNAWYPYEAFAFGDDWLRHCALGLIGLRVSPGRAQMVWDLDQASSGSVQAAADWLSERAGPRDVQLRFYKEGWAEELHATAGDAVERILELQSLKGLIVPRQTTTRRFDPESLTGAHPLLRQAAAFWRRGQALADWAVPTLTDRVLQFEARDGVLLFRRIGPNSETARRLGQRWRASAIGSPSTAAFRDQSYDARVDTAYWQAMEEGEPIYDHVLGHIDLPREGASRKPTWLPYQRLTLPVADGVAVFTRVTTDIALPFLASASSGQKPLALP